MRVFTVFHATAYWDFHEEDKIVIAEIQLLLTLTLTLIQIKIICKGGN